MLDMILTDLIGIFRILLIDITMAADNAIAIGLSIAGLPEKKKKAALFWGITAAAIIRILFAIIVQFLLNVPGLNLVGGLLLFWVCWAMFQGIRNPTEDTHSQENVPSLKGKSLGRAILSIVIADISMSMDNVLGVAGAADDNIWLLIIGLGLSVILMGFAASLIVRLLERYRWIAWVGLLIILSVAFELCYKGSVQLYHLWPI